MKTATIAWGDFSQKHKDYIKAGISSRMSVAEGAIRSGKTIDNCIIAAARLENSPDRIHLASGATIGNAKLNIGDCNGFGLEHLFRGRCRWGKYRDNEALFLYTKTGEKVIVFTGGGKADSYKRILGNSYGIWIATEINEHYDSEDSRTSFIKVASGRQIAAKDPLTLWDLNPSAPQSRIYTEYIDKYKDNEIISAYNYCHFNIYDNATLSKERIAEIETQYNKETVWYRRDILGERAVAEGLIYQQFADDPERYIIDPSLLDYTQPSHYIFNECVIGVDFGGGTSAHSFTCTGFTPRGEIVVLADERIKEALTPDKLNQAFITFLKACKMRWNVFDVYCDSAEQTLINGLRMAVAHERIGVNILNAMKAKINERIKCLLVLMSADRFKVSRNATNTIEALKTAIWDKTKLTEDIRLDNGTTNIDSLDSLEYTFERKITELVERT